MQDTHLVFNRHTAPVDAVTALQADKFVTGSQDGDVHVWSADSGKPIASALSPHGANRWISALGCVRNSDFILSGSSDGFLRTWRLTNGSRAAAASKTGAVKRKAGGNRWTLEEGQTISMPGVINQICESNNFFVCAVGQEHRLGRWERVKDAKHGINIVKKVVN